MSDKRRRLELADEALETVLDAHYAGEPAIHVDSPPGAGKSGTIVRVAQQGYRLDERTVILTNSHEQSVDLTKKFAQAFPELPVTLFVASTRVTDSRARAGRTTSVTSDRRAIDEPRQIVIANVSKGHYIDGDTTFDRLIIDEAYQVTDASYHLVSNLAPRHMLVYDRGQIAPIYRSNVSRYKHDGSGPHQPAPKAFIERHPELVSHVKLPVSRRLPSDTAAVIQPIFYPDLPFEGLCDADERCVLLDGGAAKGWVGAMHEVLNRQLSVASFVLPRKDVNLVDPQLVDAIVMAANDLVGRTMILDGEARQITYADIGVLAAHRVQVAAISARLPADIFVETANRYQGLERPIMLVWHPASSNDAPTDFHFDTGRLCVALSRHKVFCGVFYRDGLAARIRESEIDAERILDVDEDPAFFGRLANLRLIEALSGDRSIAVS